MLLPKESTYTSDDYWNLPEGEHAELIDGKLYNMAPPSSLHQSLVMELSATIRNFIKSNNGDCRIFPAPFGVNLDASDKNWIEPDISVICDKNKITFKGCVGAPDLIIEIVSPSTQSMDYLKKFLLYQKYGVREYWIVNPQSSTVNVYHFETDNSQLYSFADIIPVGIYNGQLTLCIAELINDLLK